MVRIYDLRSLAGLVKAVRHRAHRYLIVIAGLTRTTGWGVAALECALAERVRTRSADYA